MRRKAWTHSTRSSETPRSSTRVFSSAHGPKNRTPRSNPPCLLCFTDGETKIQNRESKQLGVFSRQVSQFLFSVFFPFSSTSLSHNNLRILPQAQKQTWRFRGEIHCHKAPSHSYTLKTWLEEAVPNLSSCVCSQTPWPPDITFWASPWLRTFSMSPACKTNCLV